MGFGDFLLRNRPLIGKSRASMKMLSSYLSKKELNEIKHKVNLGQVSFSHSTLGISKLIGNDTSFPTLSVKNTTKEASQFAQKINRDIEKAVTKSKFSDFSKHAEDTISRVLAFKIHGMDQIKQAITLQLFAKEPVHILLLGDPGTGKTVFLQSVEKLHPITSFGLGSGTTGVGLAVTIKGKTIKPGLLPMANEGICCIDELNLMKKEDYASLYSAMEKGFVSYDKGGEHVQFPANVRLLATANPIGDKFRGKTKDAITRQLPFESALLSRFTMVFLVRKPDLETFTKIANDIVDKSKEKIKEGDIEFIRNYIEHAEQITPEFPKKLKKHVVDFSSSVKKAEDNLFFEISPRLIHGLMNLATARARMRLSEEVSLEDIQSAEKLLWNVLENKVSSGTHP